ncbi:uncharacterized protein LOC122510015 [Leptopilina heterotoma]|uniref:uncharacterized protein LOC122510015 n=1 Tax=Leptopilina heterotoma TaxID=63436 RepID=UPI001CA98363|nr:uncharacterized protein LOC122510015 [Leptopilina heterotoma]
MAPTEDLDSVLDSLNLNFTYLTENFKNIPIIMGGDFNGRIADLNQLSPDILNFVSCVSAERLSLDKVVNSRGKIITSNFESYDFILLNGRTRSDSPANFTFVSSQGESVNDLVWCSSETLPFIQDLQVKQIATSSDHFPVFLSLISIKHKDEINDSVKFLFDSHHSDFFSSCMSWRREVGNIFDEMDELNDNIIGVIKDVATSAGMCRYSHSVKSFSRKPWWDKDCKEVKKKVTQTLKLYKDSSFSPLFKPIYLSEKKNYKLFIKEKERNYYLAKIETVNKCKNPSQFWKAIGTYRRREFSQSCIDDQAWLLYLKKCHPISASFLGASFLVNTNPLLDDPITENELINCLTKCKNGKAPGIDGINYDFFKNLPQNWILYLVQFFNKILNTEVVPKEWGRLSTIMFFKKGDPKDPDNYRPITLINCLAKIFTQILGNRLRDWSVEHDLIPESQAGFREGRGCIDNIFSLYAIIRIHLNTPKSVVYAVFIDFKGAFPSISHKLLWNKLSALGLSSKFINIMINFYSQAYTCIKTKHDFTDSVKVTQGVLQGEVLSPMLFLLFISDMEKFFVMHGCKGLSINEFTEILILGYADDYVLLSDSPVELAKKLKVLKTYCESNGLCVNTSKTKIVIFTNSPNSSAHKFKAFKYGNSSIEVTSEYVYLGVTFHRSCSFASAANKATSAANSAVGALRKTLSVAKIDSWEVCSKLFRSLVVSILAYGCLVWGLNFLEMIEKVQLSFIKGWLYLPSCTSSFAIRLETGSKHLAYIVFKQALAWINKIFNMNDTRYPKLCFLKLIKLARKNPKNKLNWFNQLKFSFFEPCGLLEYWNGINSETSSLNERAILDKFELFLRNRDEDRLNHSRSLLILSSLPHKAVAQSYLLLRMLIFYKRILSQIRLINQHVCRITFNRKIITFHSDSLCKLCRTDYESLYHLIFYCPACRHLFAGISYQIGNDLSTEEQFLKVLYSENRGKLKILVNTLVKVFEAKMRCEDVAG